VVRKFSAIRDRRQGFTLIELLVVIAIVALLVSLILPALGQARAAAVKVACASQMKQMGMAVQIYVHDNDGYLMPAYEQAPWHNSYYGWLLDNIEWRDILERGASPESRGSLYARITKCPAEQRPWMDTIIYESKLWANYGLNSDVAVYVHGSIPLNRLADISNPAHVIYMMDTRGHPWFDLPHILEYLTQDPPGGTLGAVKTGGDRHRGGVNGLYLDSHVEYVEYETVANSPEMIVPEMAR